MDQTDDTPRDSALLARALADCDPNLVIAASALRAALEDLLYEPQPLGIDRAAYRRALAAIAQARGETA